jgi:hypothetical protein
LFAILYLRSNQNKLFSCTPKDLLWYFRAALGSERVNAHVSSPSDLEGAIQAQWHAIEQLNFGSDANDANKASSKSRRRKLLAESNTRSHYLACGALRDAEAAEVALSAASGSQHVDHLYKSAITDAFCYLLYATVSEVSSLARENGGVLRYLHL